MVTFATANRLDRIPSELLSRFQTLKFPEYSKKGFLEICREYVAKREGVSQELADYVGERVWDGMKARDIRQVIRILRLGKTKDEIDSIIEVFHRYGNRIELTLRSK